MKKKGYKLKLYYFSLILIKPMIENNEINNKGKKIEAIVGILPLLPSELNIKFI